jgi:hypothetical protein
MRYIIILFCFFLFSCSSALDKTYHFSNWEQDKIELEKVLGQEEYDIIYSFLYILTNNEKIENPTLEGKTYRELLKIFIETKEKSERISMLEYTLERMIYEDVEGARIIYMNLSENPPALQFSYNNEDYAIDLSFEEIERCSNFNNLLESSIIITEE